MADKVDVKVRIPRELYDRFLDIEPAWGAFPEFVRRALEAYVDQQEDSYAQKIADVVDSVTKNSD
jgi:predicted DNA-binding protein